jgi:hypothetical protein
MLANISGKKKSEHFKSELMSLQRTVRTIKLETCRGIDEFRRGCQPTANFANYSKGDVPSD